MLRTLRTLHPLRTPRRLALPAAVALFFFLIPTPPAHAASADGAVRWADWLGVLSRLWADAGCIIDPHGGCGEGAGAGSGEAGCILDPGGRCAPRPIWAAEGCILDPHGGRCRDAALLERREGCILDPHGNCAQ